MRKSLRWGVCAIAVATVTAILGMMGFVGVERSVEAESKSDGGFIRLLDQSDELEDALADTGASSVAIAFRCPPNHKAVIARVWTDPEGELLPEASQQIEVADTPLRRNWTYRWTWIDLGDASPGLKGKLLSRWAVRSDAVDGKGRESSHGQTLEIDRFHPPGATGGGTTGSSEVRDPVPGREYAMWKAHASSGTKSGARCRLTVRFVPARPDEAGITNAMPYQPPAE